MEDTRYARKFLEWVPLVRRPVGRPRKRWMQGVEEAAERRGRNLQEITRDEDFMDRDLWRRFVEAGHRQALPTLRLVRKKKLLSLSISLLLLMN